MYSRRDFLSASAALAASALPSFAKEDPLFQISLAQWTINREIRSGRVDNLDFAKVASDHGIFALEYVNQFFMDKATNTAYLGKMKKRAADLGVKSLLIMCDREGNIGDPDEKRRNQTVDNHDETIANCGELWRIEENCETNYGELRGL